MVYYSEVIVLLSITVYGRDLHLPRIKLDVDMQVLWLNLGGKEERRELIASCMCDFSST